MKTDIGKPHALKAAMKSAPARKPVEITDTLVKGLSARVRKMPDGTIVGTWAVRCMVEGKSQRVSIGDLVAMDPQAARMAALDVKQQAANGETVQSHSKAQKASREAKAALAKATAKQAMTLHDMLFTDGGGHKSYATMKWDQMKSGHAAARSVRSLLGDAAHTPASELTRERLEAIYLTKADTAPHAAARGVAYLRPALIWYMKRDYGIPRDVLDLVEDHLSAKNGTYKKPERSRVLTPKEWAAIWQAGAEDTPQGHAMRLLMATGLRNREVCALKREEVDLDKRQLELSGARTKNGDPFRVALNDKAVAAIKAAMKLQDDCGFDTPYIFSTYGSGPIWLGHKEKLRFQEASQTDGWVFHDFRRAITTHLSEAGVDDAVTDLMLNHRASASRSGVKGTYNLSLKWEQRRAAAAKWDAMTEQWVTGAPAKVVKLS